MTRQKTLEQLWKDEGRWRNKETRARNKRLRILRMIHQKTKWQTQRPSLKRMRRKFLHEE